MIQRALCPVLMSRDAELSALEDALLAAHRGEGRVVVLAGDAGIGKTRLATELRRRAEKLDCAVMWGGCSEADLALPYLPFLEAIGNHLSDVDVEQLRAELGPAQRELGQLFPQLAPATPASEVGDPTQAKLRLFEAVLELLRIPAREHGLLLVVEDLHWADASTRELLDYMTRRVRSNRVLVLATYRRDEMHRKHPLLPTVQAWRRSGLAEVIDLDDLPPDGVAAMVGAIFDEEHISDEFRDLMHQRSEGNPFVLEEMLKEALDRGDIYRTETGWDRKSLDELRIPETVRDTILLRLERLEGDQVAVLRCAAVLGASFDYTTLVAISGVDASRMEELLDACVRQQLLEEDVSSRGRFRFRHALTREAIYEDMTAPTRERLHLRAAEVLAGTDSSNPGERAMHLVSAGRLENAVPLLLEAADAAAGRFAFAEAAALYQRALPHMVDRTQRAAILCSLGEALWRGRDARAAEEYLVEGIGLLEATGEHRQAAAHRLTLGRCRWETGRPVEARTDFEEARDTLEAFGPSAELATAYLRLSGLLGFDGEGRPAIEMGERAVEIATACGADAERIWAYNWIGLGLANDGQIDEALRYLDRSHREADERGLDWIAANALYNSIVIRDLNLRAQECPPLLVALSRSRVESWRSCTPYADGFVSHALGDLPRALEMFQENIAHPPTENFLRWGKREAARALVDMGRLDEARPLLGRPEPADERQDFEGEATVWIRFHLALGDPEEAAVIVPSVMAATSERQTTVIGLVADAVVEALCAAGRASEVVPWLKGILERRGTDDPWLARAQARLGYAVGETADAIEHARRAVQIFGVAGYPVEEARSRVVLAAALANADETDAAIAELRLALSGARPCSAGLVLRQVAEALARLGSPVEDLTSDGDALESHHEGETTGASVDTVGERLVTVMFADVRGYTQMTSATAPQEMADRIGTFHRWASTEIERHHGMVDKFAGDAVMATFNVSGASVDHCLHALHAAMALRDKAALMDLGIGVGIAVGPAIVGRMTPGANVSVLGETTNLAARLQANAAAGEIVLDSAANRRVRDWLEEHGIEVVARQSELKGFDSPVTTFVVGAASESTTASG